MAGLIIASGPGKGLDYPLGEETLIGRSSDNGVPLPDTKSSRRHSRVSREAQDYCIEDLGSRNGTLVNGESVRRRILREGDRIRIGDTELVFFENAKPEIRPDLSLGELPPSTAPSPAPIPSPGGNNPRVSEERAQTLESSSRALRDSYRALEKLKTVREKIHKPRREKIPARAKNSEVSKARGFELSDCPALSASLILFAVIALFFLSRWVTLWILK